MFADIDTSFLSKIFTVPSVKRPAAPLKSVSSPAAPVVQTFKSPIARIAGRRRSKFSKPAQTRFLKKRKLQLSSKRLAAASRKESASSDPKVAYYNCAGNPRSPWTQILFLLKVMTLPPVVKKRRAVSPPKQTDGVRNVDDKHGSSPSPSPSLSPKLR